MNPHSLLSTKMLRNALPGRRLLLTALLACLGATGSAFAQTDEIQVYTGELAAPGEYTLVWHNNYTPWGLKTPAFPGAVVSHRSYNAVPEWAYGVNDWYEAGLYLPVYTYDRNGSLGLDSIKLRSLFAVPHAEKRDFFYGVNFELSFNSKRWDEKRNTGEIRPIVGTRVGRMDFILNPILDTSFDGLNQLDFAPSARIAFNPSEKWAFAVEHYADFGPIKNFLPSSQQSHAIYGVVDYAGETTGIEFGIGKGLNGATDKVTLKLMLSWSLGKTR